MRDFTLDAYRLYLGAIIANYDGRILRFDELLSADELPKHFCAVRHDVDRRPENALRMAQLENELGVRSTYYFRTKRHTFKTDIIRQIAKLGHEVGYHYECLSDAKGDMDRATADFEVQLTKLNRIVPVRTIAMHGRPFSRFDNRDMWGDQERTQLLRQNFGILGEVYLDVDYSDTLYVNDVGRNWQSTKANRKDRVVSAVKSEFGSGEELLAYLRDSPHSRLVFQIHPERWSRGVFSWGTQYVIDSVVNLLKRCMR